MFWLSAVYSSDAKDKQVADEKIYMAGRAGDKQKLWNILCLWVFGTSWAYKQMVNYTVEMLLWKSGCFCLFLWIQLKYIVTTAARWHHQSSPWQKVVSFWHSAPRRRLSALKPSPHGVKGKCVCCVCCADLTSDQGVVYHLKHGLSKQVFSSSGFSLPPQASSSKTWNFPPLMPAHKMVLRFMPRPQVVLHCRQIIQLWLYTSLRWKLKELPVFQRFIIIQLHVFCPLIKGWIWRKTLRKASPSPTLGSASEERSLSPHRDGWPAACSLQSTGSQEPRDHPELCSTHDAPSSPDRMTRSTATTKVEGQNGWFMLNKWRHCCHHRARSHTWGSYLVNKAASYRITGSTWPLVISG